MELFSWGSNAFGQLGLEKVEVDLEEDEYLSPSSGLLIFIVYFYAQMRVSATILGKFKNCSLLYGRDIELHANFDFTSSTFINVVQYYFKGTKFCGNLISRIPRHIFIFCGNFFLRMAQIWNFIETNLWNEFRIFQKNLKKENKCCWFWLQKNSKIIFFAGIKFIFAEDPQNRKIYFTKYTYFFISNHFISDFGKICLKTFLFKLHFQTIMF